MMHQLKLLLIGTAFMGIYISAIVGISDWMKPIPEELVQTGRSFTCYGSAQAPDGSKTYYGLRIYEAPVPASTATAIALNPEPLEGSCSTPTPIPVTSTPAPQE